MTNYPYKCSCGKDGFVDIGEDKDNRYPCQKCYLEIYKGLLAAWKPCRAGV